ncbi:GNAT family N-acetyltransferase [Jiulongibacter sp. NS-SX5]|uniref:GNAT family N-acetyltransferase n=1 Tax=Jiulongibacter sp. NS-SX5 TaxID=3463854 RepID=UPI004058E438
MSSLEEQLRNPVWYSLKEKHEEFLLEYEDVLFYQPEVCTFGAFFDEQRTLQAANTYSKLTDRFFYVSEHQTPQIDETRIVLERKIDGCQMVPNQLSEVQETEEIQLLDDSHREQVYNLIMMVMPDYYQKRTYEMGKFYGIFKEDNLVAVAGQRMQTNRFIEVSAVVTHPEYTRRGLARQLIAHNAKEIIKEQKTPILHTNKGNFAIPLYESLGFELTRDMNWWLYRKK